MERLQFTVSINAPAATVYNKMIGKETFKEWTSVFNPSSDYEGGNMEGNWEKDSKVLFVGVDKQGKREGMVGYIRENVPNQFVSIEYVGILDGEHEIIEGPVAEDWQGFENYTFESHGGSTIVTVDIDVNDQMIEYFRNTYPKALEKLKEICERN